MGESGRVSASLGVGLLGEGLALLTLLSLVLVVLPGMICVCVCLPIWPVGWLKERRVCLPSNPQHDLNHMRNENRKITTNNTEMQRIIRDYYQELYANKMDSLKEMDEFLEKYNLPKLNQETYKILADLSPAWK